MVKNTDLHTHSYYSDGQISPRDLVRLAKKRGIKHLALTDHNSVGGVKEAISEGKRICVNVIPAAEIEVESGEILGYFIDIKNKELVKSLKQNREKTEDKVKDWCKKLNKGGYDITFEEIKKRFPNAKECINSFYILYLLYLKGYGRPLKLCLKLMKNKKLRPKKVKRMHALQAIKLIRKSGGVPVLAHPWVDDMEGNFKKMGMFVKAGLRGIELNNGDRPPFKQKGIDKKIKKVAKKYNLILPSGSDFHGKELVKLMPGDHNLGKNNCDERIVKELRKLAENKGFV